jgi:hypothetical protein
VGVVRGEKRSPSPELAKNDAHNTGSQTYRLKSPTFVVGPRGICSISCRSVLKDETFVIVAFSVTHDECSPTSEHGYIRYLVVSSLHRKIVNGRSGLRLGRPLCSSATAPTSQRELRDRILRRQAAPRTGSSRQGSASPSETLRSSRLYYRFSSAAIRFCYRIHFC